VLRRAVALSEDSRAESVVSPMLLLNYGRSLKELERLNEAAKFAELAHVKARAAGDETVVNQSLLVRADIYRGQGDLERAAQMVIELEPRLRRSLPTGHIAFASLALQQALNAQARGEVQKALDLANQVVTIAEEAIKAGREGAGYLQVYLVSRSKIHLQLGHLGEAAADAGRALKVLLDATEAETFSAALGRAYLALGRALSPQGKDEEARAAFRSAIENLQSALGPDHSETRAARQLLTGTLGPP
jgi:tetratricopeptide (TPR) repeat protein